MAVSEAEIHAKRREVRRGYSTLGFHSQEYQEAFDQLHEMNMAFMADRFRKERGLPPNAKTPYC